MYPRQKVIKISQIKMEISSEIISNPFLQVICIMIFIILIYYFDDFKYYFKHKVNQGVISKGLRYLEDN